MQHWKLVNAIVLVNTGALGVRRDPRLPERLADVLGRAGIAAQILELPGRRIASETRAAIQARARVVVVAGGDGSVAAAAEALAGSHVALGILPIGARNRFARDLGIPLELDRAAALVATGRTRRVDLAEVNGRPFLSASSLGVYGRLVRLRARLERGRARAFLGLVLAFIASLFSALRRFPLFRVVLESPDGPGFRLTPLVFVGNNRFRMRLLDPEGRERLDEGELTLCVANRGGRASALRLTMDTAAGTAEEEKDLEALTVRELTVHSRRRSIRVALDGETRRMRPPLRYRIRARALAVLAPVGAPPGRSEA